MSRTTVGELMKNLADYPADMPVVIPFAGNGGVVVERRDLVHEGKAEEVVGIFNDNGGRFGHNPLTEEEYQKRSKEFLSGLYDVYRLRNGFSRGVQRYTNIHGDHRIYTDFGGSQDTCYGTGYDDRIIERLLQEGFIEKEQQPYSRAGVRLATKGRAAFE